MTIPVIRTKLHIDADSSLSDTELDVICDAFDDAVQDLRDAIERTVVMAGIDSDLIHIQEGTHF